MEKTKFTKKERNQLYKNALEEYYRETSRISMCDAIADALDVVGFRELYKFELP
jgi:hypothetical protein